MPASLDTQLLRAFVTVAEVGSFTRAARLLSLTQSAISLQVSRLEDLVETRLLSRGNREVKLTAAGAAFRVYAERMLALQDEAIRSVRDLPPGRRVRLGLPDVKAIRYLPALLPRFRESHPEVQPEVYCDVSTRLVERFDAGELEVCLSVRHGDDRAGTVLGRDLLAWVASPDLALDPAEPVPLAVYPEPCVYRRHGLRALADAGRAWRIVYTSQSTAAIDIAVNQGWAVAIKSRRLADPGWRLLGAAEGLPQLEPVVLELRRSPAAREPAARELADLLEAAVREDLARDAKIS